MMLGVMLATCVTAAQATQPDPDHKVSICHRTASDTNPYVFITVDEASLPAHLNNLPGHPAKEWKTDGTFRGVAHVAGDLKNDYVAETAADCVDFESSPTPTPTETVTPTPTETTPPPTSTPPPTTGPPSKHTHTPTWTPTWTPTNGATPGEHPLAQTGMTDGERLAAGAVGLLTTLGLGSLYLARRRAAE
jgi:hypothetical protein